MTVSPPVLNNPITVDVNPAGSTINVPSGRDALIRMPRDSAGRFIPVDGPITIKGGRTKSIPGGGILGGAKTKPSGSYDSPNRGIKLSDGDNVPWTFHMEGILSLPGRYHSDIFQCGVRTNDAVSIAIKNCRWESYSWGQQSTVHADTFQIWGGALNVDIENFVATHATYQSFYWDSGDGRNLPAGPGKRPWTLENIYIKGDPAAGGFHYLYANREAAWADVRAKNVYFSPGGNNIFDSFGNAVPGMVVGAPPMDYAPMDWWKDGFYNPTGGVVTPPPVEPPPVEPPPPSYLYRDAKTVHKYDMVKDRQSDSAWNVSLGMRDTYPTYWTAAPTDVYSQTLIDAVAKWQRDVMKWTGTGADGFAGPKTCAAFKLVWDATTTAPPPVEPPPAPKSVYTALVDTGIPPATVDACLDAAAVAVHGSTTIPEAEAKLTDRS